MIHGSESGRNFYRLEQKAGDRLHRVNDLRTLKFFVHRLRVGPGFPSFSLPVTNEKSVIKSALNEYLATSYPDIATRENTSNWLMNEAAINLIPSDRFNWLKENQDACCAVWGYLVSVANNRLHGQHTGNSAIDTMPFGVLYHQMNISPRPTSHSERFGCIEDYFDNWINFADPRIQKSDFMENLKNQWVSVLKHVKVFDWLSEPEKDGCEWAWRYLEDYHRKEIDSDNLGINTINFFYPINDAEKFLAIYAALRIWDCHKAEKTLLLKNMNKAWKQRQLRREREDKKAINSYVDIKVKERLDQLARYNRCQINEVLTELINKEYGQLKSKIDERLGGS